LEEAKKSELDQLLEAGGAAETQPAAEPATEEAVVSPSVPAPREVKEEAEQKPQGGQESATAEEAPLPGPEAEALSEQAEAKSDQPEEGA
jgi:hypothetical protein